MSEAMHDLVGETEGDDATTADAARADAGILHSVAPIHATDTTLARCA
jgi:hypothetical protein